MERQFKPLTLIISGLILIFLTQCANKFYKAGMEFYEAGNYEDAIEQYNKWLSEDSDNSKAYIARAKAYKRLDSNKKAADDFSRAAALTEDAEDFMKAANLYLAIKDYKRAAKMATRAIDEDKKHINAHKKAIKSYIKLKEYKEARHYSNKLVDIEENAGNYYWRGFIESKLNNLKQAERDLRKSIELSPEIIDPYKTLADVLYRAERYDQALTICNRGLKVDKKNKPLLKTRSLVYKEKDEYPKAINDLSKILLFNPEDTEIFFKRGLLYYEFNQSMNAINDFSKVIALKPDFEKAYYYRAKANEGITNYKRAAKDYKKYLERVEKDSSTADQIKKVRKKIFELLRENNPPQIALADSVPNHGNTLVVPGNQKKLTITGKVKDESKIKTLTINNNKAEFKKIDSKYQFKKEADISNLQKVEITAKDVYGNSKNVSYTIKRSETNPPEIELSSPYASHNGEIYLQTKNPKIYIEGDIKDESLIKSIKIGNRTASYATDIKNPSFSATIDISNKENFTIKAVDAKGNVQKKKYTLNREGVNISSDNPMGKTWVVFIENSDYKTFASLDGPVKDVSTIKSALANYEIHNFIHKKNMTKKDMERFFSIELRDLVKANQVNSLLIWYAGHGKFINETGYWVPVDAKRDNEFSFFNINNLKASLQAYSDIITHTLVVTDACESGPSFYQAMRSIRKKRDCSDWKDTRAKSAQVFSSAGNELAVDQSQFTESFANTLVNNPNACIPIEDIVSKVTLSVTKSGRQEPQFGKIEGLADEGGTFFFISENK
jgi:tetratricopeptide (TPR) repeat protein